MANMLMKMRRYGGYVIIGAFPFFAGVFTLAFYGAMYSAGAFIITLVLSSWLGGKLITNKFTPLVEGDGLGVLTLDSTGNVQPYLLNLNQSFVSGNIEGKDVEDIYSRNATYRLHDPIDASAISSKTTCDIKDGVLYIVMPLDEMPKHTFLFGSRIMFFYNRMVGALITKDFLAEKEREFSEHLIVYASQKLKHLTNMVQNAFRGIVTDITKPKAQGLFSGGNWIVWVLVGLGILILVFVIYNFMSGSGAGAIQSVLNAGAVITPQTGG